MRTRLDNGMLVVLQETHAAPVASFWIFYRVGSRNELPGTTGVSHWVEHMLFKGTESYPRGEFDKAVSRAGGVFNGMTSQDWTAYFETFPSDRIELGPRGGKRPHGKRGLRPRRDRIRTHGDPQRARGIRKQLLLAAERRSAGRRVPTAQLSPPNHRLEERSAHHDAGRPVPTTIAPSTRRTTLWP